MGVNNLLKYLRYAKIDVHIDNLPREYNLSIDLATIVVPIMQESTNSKDFVARLRSYIMENRRFVALLLNACEVRAYLDMFFPRMKIDTLNDRKREKYAKMYCANNMKNNIAGKSNDHNDNALKIRNACGEIKPVVQLREIRNFVASTILQAMCEFDKTFASRCYFDMYRIGEGEIKCMSYHSMCQPNLPNVILSNDNDVLLMILLHEPHKDLQHCTDSHAAPNYYRAMIMHRDNVMQVKNNGMIFHRFAIDTIGLCQPIVQHVNTSGRCRWILVVWIICLCGTDFVLPIRMITQHRRKVLLERCVLRFKSYSHSIECCRHFSFDNFFIIMNRLFDILADDEKTVYLSDSDKKDNSTTLVKHSQPMLGTYAKERLDKIATWCARVYWNILYFIDLPVDFHLQNNRMFKSNSQMAVNAYIENESISFWNLRHLHTIHRDYLYNRIKDVCYTIRKIDKKISRQ